MSFCMIVCLFVHKGHWHCSTWQVTWFRVNSRMVPQMSAILVLDIHFRSLTIIQYDLWRAHHVSIKYRLYNLISYQLQLIHCESKKLGHFYFYCNFGKCWSIFKILSMFVPLINSHVDSRLFKAAPNFNQPLLQFVDGVDFPLVYTTLYDSTDLVINWIAIWTV